MRPETEARIINQEQKAQRAIETEQRHQAEQQRHLDRLTAKAATHRVRKSGPNLYTVTSGETGSEYQVVLLPHDQMSCTCEYAQHRRDEQTGAVTCSHTIAAAQRRARAQHRVLRLTTDLTKAARSKKSHTINQGVAFITSKK